MLTPPVSQLSRLAIGLGLATLSLAATASELNVTTFDDQYDGLCDTHCSLRDAISVGASQAQTVIRLAAGTYRLSRRNLETPEGGRIDEDANALGDFDVRGSLTILGGGTEQTIIDGDWIDRLFEVAPQASLSLNQLSLINGFTPYYGGGLENHGTALLEQVAIKGSSARAISESETEGAVGRGGGIANFGSLSLRRSLLFNNTAIGAYGYSGDGGGIYNLGALWVRDSQINQNHCSDTGDAGNGGGLYNRGTADLARVALIGNTVEFNGQGGAIANLQGTLKLVNATLSANSSGENSDGAVTNGYRRAQGTRAYAELYNVTIADNWGHGVANWDQLLIRNSIVAGNQVYDEARNCVNQGLMQVKGLLLGTGAGNCVGSVSIDNASTLTQHLFPLADNNGSQVHALRSHSAALDSALGNCPAHDQRQLDRPRDGDGDGQARCDLGAFERARP
ncbi:MAG: CSLREA domain-containing protein [Pseudomonas sp.]|uniref:choice-of-anchor Q domain-containing protein n=1 Tax=Pseudomonas sp. TaxID=306 RepID=UPI00339846B7